MVDTFLTQLDSDTLRELLARTALQDTPLVLVGPALHTERCNTAAAQLTGLSPMEQANAVLSDYAADMVRTVIADQTARTIDEELDGVFYRLQILPHREGALLAFTQDERALFDGSLRIVHQHTTRALGALLTVADKLSDPALHAQTRKQCLRIYRTLAHAEFLHDSPVTELLDLKYSDLAALCREAVANVQALTPLKLTLRAPETMPLLMDAELIRTALYNLLTNAVHVSPQDGEIEVALTARNAVPSITVADRGPGLNADIFNELLERWHRTVSFDDHRTLACRGAMLGLGLPIANRIAQLHHGTLLLSPRAGSGSKLHLSIGKLPHGLAEDFLKTPLFPEPPFTVEEVELSVL